MVEQENNWCWLICKMEAVMGGKVETMKNENTAYRDVKKDIMILEFKEIKK